MLGSSYFELSQPLPCAFLLSHDKGNYQVLIRAGEGTRNCEHGSSPMSKDLVPAGKKHPPAKRPQPPAIVTAAGRAASNAWRDFFSELELENQSTHRAYNYAVRRFLAWCEEHGLEFARIMPGDVARYLKDDVGGSPATQKLHRSAIKRYFDRLVVRHVCLINPAASVKTPRFRRNRGTTPMIEPDEINTLMESIDTSTLAGLRDRVVLAVLAYTGCRAGGVARLRRGHYHRRPGKRQLYFQEKGGNHSEIEVRSDLEGFLDEYLTEARMKTADKECPLIRPLLRKEQRFRPWIKAAQGRNEQGAITADDVCKLVKRRMRAAGLREELSAHSFRTAVATDLIDQGVPIEDVQELLGHADARTTKLYDRTNRRVTRNLVERIRIKLTTEDPTETDTESESDEEAA